MSSMLQNCELLQFTFSRILLIHFQDRLTIFYEDFLECWFKAKTKMLYLSLMNVISNDYIIFC